ncbi:hypothetical protein C7212DRAFT_365718 [Tuber magnatum]|uniref:Uncharacterized protein n=1 Tax=Tuber magnatum TaxID=42249 RepID=A0A317SJ78_9PEZI|nr:hypothetical protein C7212DRAFT_365718 [Tuber magnatum]
MFYLLTVFVPKENLTLFTVREGDKMGPSHKLVGPKPVQAPELEQRSRRKHVRELIGLAVIMELNIKGLGNPTTLPLAKLSPALNFVNLHDGGYPPTHTVALPSGVRQSLSGMSGLTWRRLSRSPTTGTVRVPLNAHFLRPARKEPWRTPLLPLIPLKPASQHRICWLQTLVHRAAHIYKRSLKQLHAF